MPHVISTLSNDQRYTHFSENRGGVVKPLRSVLIKGGANVAQKKLVLLAEGKAHRSGVATEVTTEELEFLQKNKSFRRHVSEGFLQVVTYKPEADKVARSMQASDASAPLTVADTEKNGRLAGVALAEGKIIN